MKYKMDPKDFQQLYDEGQLEPIFLGWHGIDTDKYRHKPTGIIISRQEYRFTTKPSDIWVDPKTEEAMIIFKAHILLLAVK